MEGVWFFVQITVEKSDDECRHVRRLERIMSVNRLLEKEGVHNAARHL